MGPGSREFCIAATAEAIDAVHVTSDTPLQGSFDACVLFEVLGQNDHPAEQLKAVREHLTLGGLLFVTLLMLDSPEAQAKRSQWMGFRSKRLAFFDKHNLSTLLVRSGFCDIVNWPEPDGASFLCRKAQLDRPVRLSIVLPVYNERATFEGLISTVLGKTFENLEREIIIVESNSTDGSKEIVQRYECYPEIKVIYEEKPRGKGHAVRTGLNHATGNIILIQDADLEYDIEDYDALLEPIVSQQKLFVLGSRHMGSWKMREFEDRKVLSAIFNFGQVFFTWLINVTCGVRLNDPFTMYKVFHRECLYGLQLQSNRFDLDWEIVIKFIRKGFVPLEIPVNYTSRSFEEGKKVRPILDPVLFIAALLKFRYGSLYSTEENQNHN